MSLLNNVRPKFIVPTHYQFELDIQYMNAFKIYDIIQLKYVNNLFINKT